MYWGFCRTSSMDCLCLTSNQFLISDSYGLEGTWHFQNLRFLGESGEISIPVQTREQILVAAEVNCAYQIASLWSIDQTSANKCVAHIPWDQQLLTSQPNTNLIPKPRRSTNMQFRFIIIKTSLILQHRISNKL